LHLLLLTTLLHLAAIAPARDRKGKNDTSASDARPDSGIAEMMGFSKKRKNQRNLTRNLAGSSGKLREYPENSGKPTGSISFLH